MATQALRSTSPPGIEVSFRLQEDCLEDANKITGCAAWFRRHVSGVQVCLFQLKCHVTSCSWPAARSKETLALSYSSWGSRQTLFQLQKGLCIIFFKPERKRFFKGRYKPGKQAVIYHESVQQNPRSAASTRHYQGAGKTFGMDMLLQHRNTWAEGLAILKTFTWNITQMAWKYLK